MKIIIATSMNGLGGTEHATFRLGKLLSGHSYDVVLASSDGPLIADTKKIGIRWYNINFYGGKLSYFKGMTAYVKMLKTEEPDIIHYQMTRIVPACAVAAKIASPKTKVFYHARGPDPETYPKIAKLFDRLGVYIIDNCKHGREKLIRHGFPAERTAYTYNTLPGQHDGPGKASRDEVMPGTLSRLDSVRAVNLAIDFLKVLLDRGLSVRLSVAGIGEKSDSLKVQAERLGLADKVIFPGGVCDLSAYFREVDILLNTPVPVGDHGAGVDNNVLKAGLYETLVVTYDVAGISEMAIDGQTGYYVSFEDKERFADAVTDLVRNPGLRRQMGKALHDHVTALCSDNEIYHATMAAYEM